MSIKDILKNNKTKMTLAIGAAISLAILGTRVGVTTHDIDSSNVNAPSIADTEAPAQAQVEPHSGGGSLPAIIAAYWLGKHSKSNQVKVNSPRESHHKIFGPTAHKVGKHGVGG